MLTANNREFLVVNAFAEESFGGNPAGVFPHAEGLTDVEMQLIARQLNLVETVFVFKSTEANVDRRLRYFTPLKELPVAGHPTIATWAALTHIGEISLPERKIYLQRTDAGLQKIEISSKNATTVVSMEQSPPKFLETVTDRKGVADIFGISEADIVPDLPIQAIDTGLGHIIVPLKSLEALMSVQRKIEALRNICSELKVREAQLFCFQTRDPKLDLHTRNLCPRDGIEDPACGVGNGALGAYLARYKYSEEKVVQLKCEQGHIVNMPSIIYVTVTRQAEDLKISIGGSGVIMKRGVFEEAL